MDCGHWYKVFAATTVPLVGELPDVADGRDAVGAQDVAGGPDIDGRCGAREAPDVPQDVGRMSISWPLARMPAAVVMT